MPTISFSLPDVYVAPSSAPPVINPQSHLISFQRLEEKRYKRMGLPAYSRHHNITRTHNAAQRVQLSTPRHTLGSTMGGVHASGPSGDSKPPQGLTILSTEPLGQGGKLDNSLAPFNSAEKATCGYYFSRNNDNRKSNFGIPPANLVRWRSFVEPGNIGA